MKEVYYYNDQYSYTYESGTWDTENDDLTSIIPGTTAPGAESTTNSYDSFYVNPRSAGYMDALMGGTTSLWVEGDVPVTVIGEINNMGSRSVWLDDIHSENFINETNTTYDDNPGAYAAFIGGIENDDAITGQLIGLYLDPDGNAGYLTGDLSGTVYSDAGMFEMAGTLNREFVMSTDIDPVDFYGGLFMGYGGGRMAGTLGSTGVIEGGYGGFETAAIENEPWGTYSQMLFGSFENPDGATGFTSRVGGYGGFGGYNYQRYEGQYRPNSGPYSYYEYQYNDDDSYGRVYYRKDDPSYWYTHTDYYKDGSYKKYDYNTGWTEGNWMDEGLTLSDIMNPPEEYGTDYYLNWSNEYMRGAPNNGYFIGDTASSWENGEISAEFSGRFISRTLMGDASIDPDTGISGDISGTYSDDMGTWEAVNLGKWRGTPLKYVSEFGSEISHATNRYEGRYDYTGETSSYYEYEYNEDDSYGYVRYYSDGSGSLPSADYEIYYYSNGDYDGYNNSTGQSIYGNWIEEGLDLSSIMNPPDEYGMDYITDYADDYVILSNSGYLSGLLGGTDSLWTVPEETDVAVTALGEFYTMGMPMGKASIWIDDIHSENYLNDTITTYDDNAGAYTGVVGGIHNDGALEGNLVGIYIDPSGNAGYLDGYLTGSAYEDIGMFEMDGAIQRAQEVSAAELGIDPEDLSSYIFFTEVGYGGFGGYGGYGGNGGGPLMGPASGAALAGGSASGGFVEGYGGLYTVAIMDELWGIFGSDMYGGFSGAMGNGWTSMIGGYGGFGSYGGGAPDTGYYLGSTASDWANGRLSAEFTGRFITHTKMGDPAIDPDTGIFGDVLGTYNDETGTWEAVNIGTWRGTPLSYGSESNSDIDYTYIRHEGQYDFTGDPTYSYYQYQYEDDDNSAYVRYYSDGSEGTLAAGDYYIDYYGDGSYSGHDNLAGEPISGNWIDEGKDLADIMEVPTDYAGNYSVNYDYNYLYTRYDGIMDSIMGGVESLWTEDDAPVTMIGAYSNRSGSGYWYNIDDNFSQNYLNYTATTYDGGAYVGYGGGFVGFTETDPAYHDLSGSFLALYIDPDGNAGYLFSDDLMGYGYPDLGMFEMDGTISNRVMAWTDILPKDLYYNISYGGGYYMPAAADFGIEGFLDGETYDDTTMSIGEEQWGMWYGGFSGAYDNPEQLTSWGYGGGVFMLPMGAMYMSGEAVDNLDGLMGVDVDIAMLDMMGGSLMRYWGTYANSYTDYDGSDNITGVGMGTYVEGNLAFGGMWGYGGGPGGSFAYSDGGSFGYGGGFGGLTGGVDVPWDKPAYFLTIGGYEYEDMAPGDPYIWSTPMYGGGMGGYGGSFEGFAGGVWREGSMEGKTIALYQAPVDTAILATGSGDSGISYTAVDAGTGGNNISVTYVNDWVDDLYDPDGAGPIVPTEDDGYGTPISLIVSVSGNDITVRLETDDSGAVTSSADDITNGIDANAGWLVDAIPGGTGAGVVDATAMTYLAGGTDQFGILNSDVTGSNFSTQAEYMIGDGNSGVTYTAVEPGFEGNNIYINYVVSGLSTPLSVSVSGNDITVNVATDAGGLPISTALDVAAKINGDGGASALVTAAYEDDGLGIVGSTSFYLEGGSAMWMAEGVFMPTNIMTSSSAMYTETYPFWLDYGAGEFAGGGSIDLGDSDGYFSYFYSMGDYEPWGIWANVQLGTYTGAISDEWLMFQIDDEPGATNWLQVVGNTWSEGEIAADVAGAWVELGMGTGVMGGELGGTFDPADFTWQAVAAGAYIDTPMFLNMVEVEEGQKALDKLNIPYIEIGSSDLSGSGGNLASVEMNDVKFFAYSDGAAPRIWATGDVSGTTLGSGIDVEGDTATLSGTGFGSVDFTVNNYGDNVDDTWDASVDGSGVVGGHDIDIIGGAAGTINAVGEGLTIFEGTAAGIAATIPIPQEPMED
ncbi:hypothetical protein ACFL1N_10470 [Thermodesulfobacteriota bacterium]